MKWKNLFANQMLERGYDYYRSGKVELLSVTDELAEAVVYGTDDYEVDIYYDNGEIEDMYCDCPYADDENNCKHMAAVLYTLDNGTVKKDSADKLINEASAETFREYLLKAIAYDEELKDKFVRFLQIKDQSINPKEYESHLNSLIRKYSHRGYIEWDKTSDFIDETLELLDECTNKLIEEKRFYDTFETVKYYYGKIVETDMDDDGDISYFHDMCLEILQNIVELSDSETKSKIFDASLKMLSQRSGYFSDLYFDFIRNNFEEEKYLRKMLEYTDTLLARMDLGYSRKKWVMYHIELMDKLKYSDDEMMSFCKKYWDIADVCRYMTDRYISEDNIEKAIQLLEKSLMQYKDGSSADEEIHYKIKDLYKRSGDKRNYVKELWLLLTEYRLTDIEVYLEFKALFDADEWEDTREKLYSSMKYQAILPDYFIEEKLTDRLASYVFTNKDIYYVERYESYLAEDYSENILAVYMDCAPVKAIY